MHCRLGVNFFSCKKTTRLGPRSVRHQVGSAQMGHEQHGKALQTHAYTGKTSLALKAHQTRPRVTGSAPDIEGGEFAHVQAIKAHRGSCYRARCKMGPWAGPSSYTKAREVFVPRWQAPVATCGIKPSCPMSSFCTGSAQPWNVTAVEADTSQISLNFFFGREPMEHGSGEGTLSLGADDP